MVETVKAKCPYCTGLELRAELTHSDQDFRGGQILVYCPVCGLEGLGSNRTEAYSEMIIRARTFGLEKELNSIHAELNDKLYDIREYLSELSSSLHAVDGSLANISLAVQEGLTHD